MVKTLARRAYENDYRLKKFRPLKGYRPHKIEKKKFQHQII